MTDSSERLGQDTIPAEIDRWNWGAFLLNWVWGVGNNTYIALLTFIPFVGFVVPFVLGAKGSAWAWRNGRWDSVAHFKRVQRRWAIWGVVFWIAAIALVAAMFGGLFYALKTSEAYHLGVARLESSSAAADMLGRPIATGFPQGSINLTGLSGEATLTFTATGSKAAGHVVLHAVKQGGTWSLTDLKLFIDTPDNTIDLLKDDRAMLLPRGVASCPCDRSRRS